MSMVDILIVPAVLILGIYCFVWLVRARTRSSTRISTRTAESMYPNYADSPRQQRKHAKEHGTRRDDGSPLP